MANLPELKSQEVINDVRPHQRLSGVYEVVCESGTVYLTKSPANYKVGNVVEIRYVEIRKPKKNGGEWVNLWTNDPAQPNYRPKPAVAAKQVQRSSLSSSAKFEELMAAVNEISAQLIGLTEKVDSIADDLAKRP
jgi:hypothetical protein